MHDSDRQALTQATLLSLALLCASVVRQVDWDCNLTDEEIALVRTPEWRDGLTFKGGMCARCRRNRGGSLHETCRE